MRRPIITAIAATIAVSLFFLVTDGHDILVSGLFYVPGVGFPATASPSLKLLRSLGLLSINLGLICVGVLTLARCLPPVLRITPWLARIRPSALVFLVASAALGPGLVANVILKDHWGRARPVATDLFGGDHAFSLPWVMSDACVRNCSFISGEGSAAFWFVAFAFVVPRRLTKTVAIGTLCWATIISLNRIAFGGHYASDILIGWGLMLIVILICRDLVLNRWAPTIDRIVARMTGDAAGSDGPDAAGERPPA